MGTIGIDNAKAAASANPVNIKIADKRDFETLIFIRQHCILVDSF
jgi:hypothetical protein